VSCYPSLMRRTVAISVRLACLAFTLLFCALFLEPQWMDFAGPALAFAGSRWFTVFLGVFLELQYLGIGLWAAFACRKADGRAHQLLLLSIVAIAALVLASDFAVWWQPHFASLLHLPITALAYLFSVLVIFALLLDVRSRRQSAIAIGL